MRNYVLPIVAVVVLSTTAPAMAYDSGGLISMQHALAALFHLLWRQELVVDMSRKIESTSTVQGAP